MNKDLGRLDLRDEKILEEQLSKIFKLLEDGQQEDARSTLVTLISTPNFFIREFIGKKLAEYKNTKSIEAIIKKLEGHKFYGVRATIIFYYFNKYITEPEKILPILEKSWSNTPWETEYVIYDLWQNFPALMKDVMLKWADSEFEKKRAFAYHGLEAIAGTDIQYVTNIVEKNLDSDNEDMQKRIVLVLMNAIKSSPGELYSYIRHWLSNSSENRKKTLFTTMKKMITQACYSNVNFKSPRTEEFYNLTMQAIRDWKEDSDYSIASMGDKLVYFSKSPHLYESESS